MKRYRWLFWFLPFLLAVALYTLLVKPRRFFQCLPATIQYFTRQEPATQQAPMPEPLSGNRVRLLVNGDEVLPVLLESIDAAEESIRWQVMLYHPDEVGKELAEALAQAAWRGVKVQVSFNHDQTVNGTLAHRFPREQSERLNRAMQEILGLWRESGVEFRDNPAGTEFPLAGVSSQARSIQQSIQQSTCIPANHYDHRKLFIVDNRLAFEGGMNVGRQYFYHIPADPSADMVVEAGQRRAAGQPEAWAKWFDAGVLLEGPVVSAMVDEFNWKWEVLGGSPLPGQAIEPVAEGMAVQFLTQRPGRPQIGARFFELMENAREEIWVANPFVSYDPALEALQRASRRGVCVVFVYPYEHQELEVSRNVFSERVDDLLEAGVELYFNDLRMAHTKLLVVDGRQALVGSFNLNHRSFRHDLETAVLVEDEAFAAQTIERVFRPYLSICRLAREPLRVRPNPVNWFVQPFT